MRGSEALDPVFGERALVLAARVRRHESGHAFDAAHEELRVELDPAGLEPSTHAALQRLAAEARGTYREVERGRWLLALPPEGLQELHAAAREAPSSGLEALLAAYANARRPRDPAALMGILNVTPDSFSDGGRFLVTERAVEHGLALAAAGADWIDVGGESTRPGSEGVGAEEELERVLPVIEGLARETSVPLSIDTSKCAVARAALDHGARAINDVSAGTRDEGMLPLAAERDVQVFWMHMQRTPRDMQRAPRYDDVVLEVTEFLRRRVAASLRAGSALPRIAIDPGIGFGKRLNDNLELIRSLGELRSLGLPILLGVSRKSFLGTLSGTSSPAERDAETLAALCLADRLGADLHRVHDVAGARRALAVQRSLLGAGEAASSAAPRSALEARA